MVVLGVLLKASVARLLAVSGTRDAHKVVASKVNKLEIPKNPTRDDVENFVQTFRLFCSVNAVDLVVINRRNTSGNFGGGAATFLLEGVLLATAPCPIEFVHAKTLTATDARHSALKNKPGTADLAVAYDYAFEYLPA